MILVISINDYEFDDSLIKHSEILFNILSVLCKHDLGLRVVDDVFASFLVVGGVNSDGDASGHERAVEGDKPFWSVESNNVDN